MYIIIYTIPYITFLSRLSSFSTYYLKVASGLPVNNHLWGAVDVYGRCAKIKSELLSGELDGIAFMHVVDLFALLCLSTSSC